MPLQQFKLETLGEMDPKVLQAAAKHLHRAALDCMDRPGDKKPRVVTLKIGLVPVLETDGDCTEVAAEVHVSSKVPDHKTKVHSLGLRKNGVLVFNPDSPDSVDQTTLFEDEDR